MISTPDRQNAIALIDQAKAAGARRTPACAELGIDARTCRRWLTVSQLAQQLGIPRRWIDQRIRSGVIVAGPRPPMRLHLFPDDEATVAAFRSLRAGQIDCLRFDDP